MNPVVEIVGALVGLLLIASIVLAICKRFKFPFTVTLVLTGMLLAQLSHWFPNHIGLYINYTLSPDVILYVCLPTLIFESAFNLDARQLHRNLLQILTLAIPGLLLSTFIIGGIVTLLTPFNFISSLLLGAILSATDPVAVISIFKQLGAPKRLTVLVEGESLFNDATSIVAAKLIFGIMIAGVFTTHQLAHGIEEFCIEFFGGILVGGIIAYFIGVILGKVESDAEIEISLTTILAYFTFIIGQNFFHVSGVMATLTAGLVMSHWRYTKISPSIVHYIDGFWEFLAYVANALIFLMIGLSANIHAMKEAIIPLIVVIVAMLISRACVIFGLVPLVGKLPNVQPISQRFQAVMYWGGLRGAIALAIILSLGQFEHAETFIALVTGAVLFTLIIKGLTIEKLVHALKLDVPPLSDSLATLAAKISAKQKAIALIPELQQGGLFSPNIANELKQQCQQELDSLEIESNDFRAGKLSERNETKLLFLQCLATEKNLFYDMFVKGHISERAQRYLNDKIEVLTDTLRYGGNINKLASPAASKNNYKFALFNFLDRFPILNHLIKYSRSTELTKTYSAYWGYYQGAEAVIKYLEQTKTSHTTNPDIIKKVALVFNQWKNDARTKLDDIAEQFPEFVASVQHRFAERLVLRAEIDAIRQQAIAGLIPLGVAHKLNAELDDKIRRLRETPASTIELDPHELLRKVSFFKELAPEDFEKISALLRSRVTQADEIIIKQGDTGESLFIIMRGVIRVSREENGQSIDLATLMAGQFFGEMALLRHEKRNATCRSVTPCALYQLRKNDFEHVKAACPAIQAAIEEANRERS